MGTIYGCSSLWRQNVRAASLIFSMVQRCKVSLDNCCGSRVAGMKSRVGGMKSRVAGTKSRVWKCGDLQSILTIMISALFKLFIYLNAGQLKHGNEMTEMFLLLMTTASSLSQVHNTFSSKVASLAPRPRKLALLTSSRHDTTDILYSLYWKRYNNI